jgi:2-methylisocitrate lyase-like PEP mutase family enzyme
MSKNRVQRILDRAGAVALPGVYDTLSAKICQRAGFPLAFVSGYSVAAATIGEPDLGLLTQTEMCHQARRICMSVDIPVIVDADTGYGNTLNVHRTVHEWIAAGAAGCFLEDQVWPKRCGHLRGKKLVDRDEYLRRIQAAVEARAGRDFFVVARTDALAVAGMDEAVARVVAAREAGADASFVEAPGSLEHLTQIGQRCPAPNVANMIQGGKTPVLNKQQLEELGFHLILHPLCSLFAAAGAIRQVCQKLHDDGDSFDPSTPTMSFGEFNELIGVEEKIALAERFEGKP